MRSRQAVRGRTGSFEGATEQYGRTDGEYGDGADRAKRIGLDGPAGAFEAASPERTTEGVAESSFDDIDPVGGEEHHPVACAVLGNAVGDASDQAAQPAWRLDRSEDGREPVDALPVQVRAPGGLPFGRGPVTALGGSWRGFSGHAGPHLGRIVETDRSLAFGGAVRCGCAVCWAGHGSSGFWGRALRRTHAAPGMG